MIPLDEIAGVAEVAMAAAAGDETGIFLWGARMSGKSAFAGSLYGLSLPDAHTTRWVAHPKDALDPYTSAAMKHAYLGLKDRRGTKTDIGNPRPLRLLVRKLRGRDGREVDQLRLSIGDPAGEFVSEQDLRSTTIGRDVHRRAAGCRGLVWLVTSPESAADRIRTQTELLPQLLALLDASGGRQIGIPVAICLSMVDRLPPDEQRRALADPRGVIAAHVGPMVPRWFEAVCPIHRFFAVSSAGTEPGVVRPINVSEVLDWVVDADARRDREQIRAWRAALGAVDGARRVARASTARRVVGALALGLAAWQGARMVSGSLLARESAAGDVVPPALGDADAEALLARVRELARDRQWQQVVDELSGAAPAANPVLRRGQDSLLAIAALRRALVAHGAEAERLAALARARASAVIDAGTPGSLELASLHFVRASACEAAAIGCDLDRLVGDYVAAQQSPWAAQRRIATAALRRLQPEP